jgi:hypothetical protein
VKCTYVFQGVKLSSLEHARWAVFLTALDIEWQYKPGPAHDFVLPQRKLAAKCGPHKARPTPAEARTLGMPICVLPLIKEAGNKLTAITGDDIPLVVYLLAQHRMSWCNELSGPWSEARDAFTEERFSHG